MALSRRCKRHRMMTKLWSDWLIRLLPTPLFTALVSSLRMKKRMSLPESYSFGNEARALGLEARKGCAGLFERSLRHVILLYGNRRIGNFAMSKRRLLASMAVSTLGFPAGRSRSHASPQFEQRLHMLPSCVAFIVRAWYLGECGWLLRAVQ